MRDERDLVLANARTFRLVAAELRIRAARTKSLWAIAFQGTMATVVWAATAMEPAMAILMAMAMATTTALLSAADTAKALRLPQKSAETKSPGLTRPRIDRPQTGSRAPFRGGRPRARGGVSAAHLDDIMGWVAARRFGPESRPGWRQ